MLLVHCLQGAVQKHGSLQMSVQSYIAIPVIVAPRALIAQASFQQGPKHTTI